MKRIALSVLTMLLACSGGGGGGGPTGPQIVQVGGSWTYHLTIGTCSLELLLVLSQNGTAFSGTYQGNQVCPEESLLVAGSIVAGNVSGTSIAFDLDDSDIHHVGTISGAAMGGTVTFGPGAGGPASASWTATAGGTVPAPPPPGRGSRQQPAGLNQLVRARTNGSIWGDGVIELTLLEVIRGAPALAMVKAANQFNDDPPAGHEYVLARFRVRVVSGDAAGVEMNHARWDAVSADGVVYNLFVSVAGLVPDLRTTIFPGGTHEGFTYFLVRTGDQPFALFDEGNAWAKWFRL